MHKTLIIIALLSLSVTSYSQIKPSDKGLFITYEVRDSIFKKMVHRDALIVRNADLEKIITQMDSIALSLNKQLNLFNEQVLSLNNSLRLSRASNDSYEKIIALDKLELQGAIKNGKKNWWRGLSWGVVLSALGSIAFVLFK